MCAYRAIGRDALRRLDMREMTYGWNIEMQMKAARAGLRIEKFRCLIGVGWAEVQGRGIAARHAARRREDRIYVRPVVAGSGAATGDRWQGEELHPSTRSKA